MRLLHPLPQGSCAGGGLGCGCGGGGLAHSRSGCRLLDSHRGSLWPSSGGLLGRGRGGSGRRLPRVGASTSRSLNGGPRGSGGRHAVLALVSLTSGGTRKRRYHGAGASCSARSRLLDLRRRIAVLGCDGCGTAWAGTCANRPQGTRRFQWRCGA